MYGISIEWLFEAAEGFDVDKAIEVMAVGKGTREVETGVLLRYIQDTYMVAFEVARDVLNVLVQIGRVVISSFATVRFL